MLHGRAMGSRPVLGYVGLCVLLEYCRSCD
jgi:hypothetical protein